MTARKRFKQLVRARMAKTGESYVTALRHLEARQGMPPSTRRVRKADLGLTLHVPVTWVESVPELRNSLDEVLRLASDEEPHARRCILLWTPKEDDPNTRRLARQALKEQLAQLDDPRSEEATYGGRAARRLTGTRTSGDVTWHVVRFFVECEDRTLDLSFESVDGERDHDLFEEIVESLEIGPPADRGLVEEMALFRYSGSARRAVRRAADIARAADPMVLSLDHLLRSLAQTPEGDAVTVVLGALGVDISRLDGPQPIARRDEFNEPVHVGPELYRVLTREAQRMAVTSVKPVDILSAIVHGMPDALAEWRAQ